MHTTHHQKGPVRTKSCMQSHRCSTCRMRTHILCVTWRIHMCDVTRSYVWRDSCMCETSLVHMCDMTHPYVCDLSHAHPHPVVLFMWVTWRIEICDVTHVYVRHASGICVTWRIPMCVTWLIHVWHMCVTHMCDIKCHVHDDTDSPHVTCTPMTHIIQNMFYTISCRTCFLLYTMILILHTPHTLPHPAHSCHTYESVMSRLHISRATCLSHPHSSLPQKKWSICIIGKK